MVMDGELFESAPRSAGDKAGVFEADGETGYFYLFDTSGEKADRIVGAIWVFDGPPDFSKSDLLIKWNSTEDVVGLFIRNKLVSAFEADTGATHPEDFDASSDFES